MASSKYWKIGLVYELVRIPRTGEIFVWQNDTSQNFKARTHRASVAVQRVTAKDEVLNMLQDPTCYHLIEEGTKNV